MSYIMYYFKLYSLENITIINVSRRGDCFFITKKYGFYMVVFCFLLKNNKLQSVLFFTLGN